MNIVILCGGTGSRLWPKSRNNIPKQLLKITNEYSLLQNTVIRINKLLQQINNPSNIYIICNTKYYDMIESQVNSLNIMIPVNYIIEPIGKDSGPAICIASLLDNINMNTIVVPSDHIFNDSEFIKCCLEGIKIIDNNIITFGIKPSRIETGFGYIKVMKTNMDYYIIDSFIEKPNYDIAKQFYESDLYLWNAGIFIFKNNTMIECFKKYNPDILDICTETLNNSIKINNIIKLPFDKFNECKSISVDYAIMELLCNGGQNIPSDNKITNINAYSIQYKSDWDDIGSFNAIYNLSEKDANMNVLVGDNIIYNSKNCYVDNNNKLITLIGMDNVIVINTDDAILICNKDSTQDIKKIVESLKNNNRKEI